MISSRWVAFCAVPWLVGSYLDAGLVEAVETVEAAAELPSVVPAAVPAKSLVDTHEGAQGHPSTESAHPVQARAQGTPGRVAPFLQNQDLPPRPVTRPAPPPA